MCFKNLPIEFDADGKAHLIPGVANPYQYQSVSLEERDKKLMEIARARTARSGRSISTP